MAVSTRTRFEVFKRDKFTCQYCGQKAPDVILHVDHIVAKNNGGSDGILNLATSCDGCNFGKSDIPLSDNVVLNRQRKQLEETQEKRNQIRMIAEWQNGLIDTENEEVEVINEMIGELISCHLTTFGLKTAKRLVRKHGFEGVLSAVREVCTTGAKTDDVLKSVEKKLCYEKMVRDDPRKARYAYVGGTLRNRFPQHWSPEYYSDIKFRWDEAGRHPDDLYTLAKQADSWNDFLEDVWNEIQEQDLA